MMNCDCGAAIARVPTHSSWCATKNCSVQDGDYIYRSRGEGEPYFSSNVLGDAKPLTMDILKEALRSEWRHVTRQIQDAPPTYERLHVIEPPKPRETAFGRFTRDCNISLRGGVRQGMIIGTCCGDGCSDNIHVAHRICDCPPTVTDARAVMSVLASNCPCGMFCKPSIHLHSDDLPHFEKSE